MGITVEGCPGDGWQQVAFLNMSDPSQMCPSGLQLSNYSIRSCSRVTIGLISYGCDSVTFSVSGQEYTSVCGRATAYQFRRSIAFAGYHVSVENTVEDAYADGLLITHGQPRKHIWTFTGGHYTGNAGIHDDTLRCPCVGENARPSPPFVDEDYFCDSATTPENFRQDIFHSDNALWDGIGSANSCYNDRNVPWFYKELSNPSTDDIEMRLCLWEPTADLAIQEMEIYVR